MGVSESGADDEGAGGTGIILRKLGRAGQAGGPKAGDLAAVRDMVQSLCSNTQPLAKCMDYLQEDLEIMTKEYRCRGLRGLPAFPIVLKAFGGDLCAWATWKREKETEGESC